MSSEPCGKCSSCLEIAEGRSVDLLEVDAASRTKVEDPRERLENVQYAPTRSRYKVYLIDEVHMLSNHSFNALLKTLEEPPPHVKFVLATTDPEQIPITVLSRCPVASRWASRRARVDLPVPGAPPIPSSQGRSRGRRSTSVGASNARASRWGSDQSVCCRNQRSALALHSRSMTPCYCIEVRSDE